MRGEGEIAGSQPMSTAVLCNECAHHVTWSPNKLWRSTSVFSLCPRTTAGCSAVCRMGQRRRWGCHKSFWPCPTMTAWTQPNGTLWWTLWRGLRHRERWYRIPEPRGLAIGKAHYAGEIKLGSAPRWVECREVKTGFCWKRSMQTGSSETLIGWKSGQTTFVPLWDQTEGAWLWTWGVGMFSPLTTFDGWKMPVTKAQHQSIQRLIKKFKNQHRLLFLYELFYKCYTTWPKDAAPHEINVFFAPFQEVKAKVVIFVVFSNSKPNILERKLLLGNAWARLCGHRVPIFRPQYVLWSITIWQTRQFLT